jgi:hypothetical protein
MAEQNRNVWYLAVVVAAFIALPTSLAALSSGVTAAAVAAVTGMPMCSEVCDEFADCDTECSEPAFLMPFNTTCFEYEACDLETVPDFCGNNSCGSSETGCDYECKLIDDEPTCDDTSCDLGEDGTICPEDCTSANECEDNTCDLGESVTSCPEDCEFAGFCYDDSECGDYGQNYICQGGQLTPFPKQGRCTYAPNAMSCHPSFEDIDCPGAMKCIKDYNGEGRCVPRF